MTLILRNIVLPLAEFTLEINAEIHGPITILFGPSGSGKTCLLDLIAGLREPPSAFIQLGEQVLTDTSAKLLVPTRRRRIGYVPQDLALFPHLTVQQNLDYGSRGGGHLEGNKEFTAAHVTEVLEIEPLLRRGIQALSGGEKQRVALARALLAAPDLLLLDEPLANLDMSLKSKILPYLSRVRDEFRIPMLYVTHDRFETLSLADEMVVLIRGQINQMGPVQEVFSRPANVAVASLLSIETIVPGRVLRTVNGLVAVRVGNSHLFGVAPGPGLEGSEVHVCIRADDVILFKGEAAPSSARNHLPAIVRSLSRSGNLIRVELECGFLLVALLTNQACAELKLQPGAAVTALVKAPNVHLIARGALEQGSTG